MHVCMCVCTHPRWPAVTHSARSRRSYGKIGDFEQSTLGSGGRVEWGQSGIGGVKICIGVRLCKQLHVVRLPIVYSLQNLMEIFSVLLKIHCVRL